MSELKLSKFIETIPVRSYEKFRVDKRLTYHFENADIGLVHWERLKISISEFYTVCGHRYANAILSSDLWLLANYIRRRMKFFFLPVHNPVAFFYHLTDSTFANETHYQLFDTLLPYVLSCSGILFGTAFDREGIHTVRPCDIKYIVPAHDNRDMYTIYADLLEAQAKLKSGHSFKSDFAHYSRVVYELSLQRKRIIEWRNDWENEHTRKPDRPPFSRPLPWSDNLENLNKWEDMFFSFLDLYERYCMSQLPESSPMQQKTCKQALQDIRLSAQFIFQMERMTLPLLDALQIEDPEQNRMYREQWIKDARATLQSESAVSQLNALKNSFQNDFYALTNANYIFAHITSSSDALLVPNQQNNCPLLNELSVFRRLTAKEKQDLFWYRKLPVAHWIEQLCSPSSKPSLRKIFPFYLGYFFWNKEKPLRPFERSNSRFSPKSLPFDSKIASSSHVHAIRLQNSHHKFYLDLITWCKKYYPGEAALPLCHALYTFHRRHLVTEPPSPENYHLPNDLHIIYQGLLRLFDFPVSMLPQYTENPITENEFNYFFYVDTSQEVKQIRKHIRSMITDELASTYGKLTFLDPDGFGHSYFTKKWHQNLATWLSDLINEDRTLSAYVSGGDPNLAQIELAIQFSCCQQLRQIWANDVLRCYKNCLFP